MGGLSNQGEGSVIRVETLVGEGEEKGGDSGGSQIG